MHSVFSLIAWIKDQSVQLTFAHGTMRCRSEFTGVQGYKPKQPWQMEKQLGKAKHKKLIKTNCKILPLGKNNQLCKQRMRNLFSNSSEKYLGATHSALVNNILLLKKEKNTRLYVELSLICELSTMAGTDRTPALLMCSRIQIGGGV